MARYGRSCADVKESGRLSTRIVGITGGIGSGKSCVSRLLASFCNIPLINIDARCKDLLEKGRPGWQALHANLSAEFFDKEERLDRSVLREEIFSNPLLRNTVDSLLHPLVRVQLQTEIASLDSSFALVEIPLLYEAGWQQDMDCVIVVYVHPDLQCRRVVLRDGVSGQQAAASIASQLDLEQKRQLADHVIDNSAAWTTTRKAVLVLAEQLEDHYL